MNEKKKLLLASQSPRRRELLRLTGLGFDATSADVDEGILPEEQPADYVLRLAEAKARNCCDSTSTLRGEGALVVIGSDTVVVDAGEILGKPRNAREAESMLRQLRGRTHQVYTALAVYDEASDRVFGELCISDVPMRAYDEEEMLAYIRSGDPMDKAGSYDIQNADFHPVASFSGCFASVMGLPLCHLTRSLKKAGLLADDALPQRCQSSLDYECTISDAVLRGDNIG